MGTGATLVKAWRATFDPEVGRLLEQWGSANATPLDDLPLEPRERAAVLVQLAKRASDDERSSVLQAVEAFAREASGAPVASAIEAWADLEPDPRVARMALRTLLRLEQQLTGRLWRRLVACIEHHGDVGVVKDAQPYLEVLRQKGGDWGFPVERVEDVLEKLATWLPGRPLETAALAALAAEVEDTMQRAPSVDGASLLEAVVAAPDDDAPRAVFADWLTEQGSPRGEFISLQLMKGKAPAKRVKQLLAAHRGLFLAELEGVVDAKSAKFERGFVREATVSSAVPDSPLMKLLESARVPEAHVHQLRRVAPALKRVDIAVHKGAFRDVFDQPWVEALKFDWPGRPYLDAPVNELVRDLVESPLGKALRRLHVNTGVFPMTFSKLVLPPMLESMTYSAVSGSFEFAGNSLSAEVTSFDSEELISTVISFIRAVEIDPVVTISASAEVMRWLRPLFSTALPSATWVTLE